MQIKIIRNDADHEKALERIRLLMGKELPDGSDDAEEFDLLVLTVTDYESRRYPIEPASPVDMILHRMDQMGMTRKDLVPMIGAPSKVSEVLSGKRNLSLPMILRLSEGLKVPAQLLIPKAKPKPVRTAQRTSRTAPIAPQAHA